MFRSANQNVDFPKLESDILEYWQKNKILEKYLQKNNKSPKIFSFLDGPITANNPMGIHHAWGRTYKDLWQRYFNLKGFCQRFQNGFDCQGLWVEVEVEKELGFKSKKEIEVYGIANFVNKCKERVIKYSTIQSEQSKRLGYFMDWDNSYFTMSDENNYMIWFLLKECWQRNWIYKGHESIPWCPRCETAISQHEILTEDYQELTHETVFFKLPIEHRDFSLLVWTTTPWTIPGNVAVAVNPKFKYKIWKTAAGDRVIAVNPKEIKDTEALSWFKRHVLKHLQEEKKGSDLTWDDLKNLKYLGPFDDLERISQAKQESPDKFHTIISAEELVTASKGTGLLHVATGCGEEDFKLGKDLGLPIINLISDNADYLDKLGLFSKKNAKLHPEIIIEYLRNKDRGRFLFRTTPISHRYPVCWRCHSELVWKIADEWYIAMDRLDPSDRKKRTLRKQLKEVAKKIHWLPSFGLDRELDWLENMHDWLISKKNRYWGLALPIFECKNCQQFEVIGSREELQQRSIFGWDKFEGNSPHRPWIDEVKIDCRKCKKPVSRISDVGNPWLDAGIVSFSTYIDPKKRKLSYTYDKKYWQQFFPADFITESFPGQFKNWFYSLIVMGTVLEKTNPFKTVLGFATLLGEDGRPMHKSWGNAIDFNQGAEKIGVDVMRWMFSLQNPQQNILFGYKRADEVRRKFHLLLWNVYNFFLIFASADQWKVKLTDNQPTSSHVLDKWILSRLNHLIDSVERNLTDYNCFLAAKKIENFVTDLSQWYVRRSRDRVGLTVKNTQNKNNFYCTLHEVLVKLSIVLSPFLPFLTEEIFTNLTGQESVHLQNWPQIQEKHKNRQLEEEMNLARTLVEKGHSFRKAHNLKVRMPLLQLELTTESDFKNLDKTVCQLVIDELNVKNIVVNGKFRFPEKKVKVTDELLKKEGEAREIVRKIQLMRRQAKCKLNDRIAVYLTSWPEEFSAYIKDKTLTMKLIRNKQDHIRKI